MPCLRFFKQWMLALVISGTLLLDAGSALAAEGGPKPAVKPLTEKGQMVLSESDRCPVCAMFPARMPESAAALTFDNGETVYFCGNGCLLRSWLRPAVYLGRSQKEIDRLVVQDYFSGKPIDGRSATWVAGSDVVGPMGPAIVALGDVRQLETFKKRHGGKTVFTFDQINDVLWHRISGRELPPPKTE